MDNLCRILVNLDGVNRPIKTKLKQMSNFTCGTAALTSRHCRTAALPGYNSDTTAPTDNFESLFKISEWKPRSEKFLSFLQV